MDITASRPASHVPHVAQPGTLLQQLAAVDVYLVDPTRHDDPAAAWTLARAVSIPHVSAWYSAERGAEVRG